MPVVNGVATFSNLVITTAGTTFQLTATATLTVGTKSVTTSPFTINPLAASQLLVTTQPPFEQATVVMPCSPSTSISSILTFLRRHRLLEHE